jgi:hypothetical protein
VFAKGLGDVPCYIVQEKRHTGDKDISVDYLDKSSSEVEDAYQSTGPSTSN